MSHSLAGIQESDHEQTSIVQSDGNLGLNADAAGEFHISFPQNHPQQPNSTLETIPSFSVYNSRDEEGEAGDRVGEADGLERSITIGSDFSFGEGKGVGFTEAIERIKEAEENPTGVDDGVESLPLFLAKGLGIGISDGSSAVMGGKWDGKITATKLDLSGVEGLDVENYYRKLVEEKPCNALYLRNYAHFLYQTKEDLEKAEEYYSRAILAAPGDGEALSQYAKLIWERHHDYERALSYFELAAQLASDDSDVLAAYAYFLWNAEDVEQGKEDGSQHQCFVGFPISHGERASA